MNSDASFAAQFQFLLLLALPVACIAWTITHEEIFREPREFCAACSKNKKNIFARKFFYVFTCEYCLSHYIAALFIALSGFTMLLPGWKGYVISIFSLVWTANMYMGIFLLVRTGIKKEKTEITYTENEMEKNDKAL